MRDKRHALLLLLLWKWKCCCCSWYANTRQVGHLRRSAVKLCVCVTYNQLQISGSRLKWLQLFIKRSCMQRVSVRGKGGRVDHLSKQSLRSYQCSTLASLGFHLHRKERLPFISFLPSFLCVIVIVRNIIMDNQSINNIMRQSPSSFQALVLSMPLIVLLLLLLLLLYKWSAAFAWFDICKCKTQFEMHI